MSTKAKYFFEKELGPITFGSFLTAARMNLDLSQSELARKLKISRSMVCDIEKGRVIVSLTLAIKIAKLAGFSEKLAVQHCLEDQLRKAKIKFSVSVDENKIGA